jgi:hypothetical protein
MIRLRNDSGVCGTIDNEMAGAEMMPLTDPISLDAAKGAHTSIGISGKEPTCRRTRAALPVKKEGRDGRQTMKLRSSVPACQ